MTRTKEGWSSIHCAKYARVANVACARHSQHDIVHGQTREARLHISDSPGMATMCMSVAAVRRLAGSIAVVG